MEHRWGERVRVDLPIRITAHPFWVRHGRLFNLSVSGALIKADPEWRLLQRIQISIELPQKSRCEAPVVDAYVTRSTKSGLGVEWCEFSPPAVSMLLSVLAARPHVRLRKPEKTSGITITRQSMPLLKHGS